MPLWLLLQSCLTFMVMFKQNCMAAAQRGLTKTALQSANPIPKIKPQPYPTFMAILEQYCGRPRGAGTPMEALRVTKHCEGTPRKESLARFTSLYSSASARHPRRPHNLPGGGEQHALKPVTAMRATEHYRGQPCNRL